jgi:hypothetical protein
LPPSLVRYPILSGYFAGEPASSEGINLTLYSRKCSGKSFIVELVMLIEFDLISICRRVNLHAGREACDYPHRRRFFSIRLKTCSIGMPFALPDFKSSSLFSISTAHAASSSLCSSLSRLSNSFAAMCARRFRGNFRALLNISFPLTRLLRIEENPCAGIQSHFGVSFISSH